MAGRLKSFFRRKRVLVPGIALAAALFSWFVLPRCFELPVSLMENPAGSPVLLDRNGEPLHHLVLPDFTRSSPVSLKEIPEDLVACTLAAEDRRFRSHGGIDLLATYAGQRSDLADWLADAQINRDRNLRLQYLAGMGLNTNQSGGIYQEMVRQRRFPEKLFTGSDRRVQTLRFAMEGPQTKQ